MPYTPTVWKAGDVVLPELLTKMEQGIAQRSALTVPIVESYEESSPGNSGARSASSGSSSRSLYYVLQERTENIVSAFLAGRTVLVKIDGDNEHFSKEYVEISCVMDFTESLGVWGIETTSPFYDYRRFYGKTGEYPTTKEPDEPDSGGSSVSEK